MTACVFSAYHAVKNRQIARNECRTQTSDTQSSTLLEDERNNNIRHFADSFLVDARKLLDLSGIFCLNSFLTYAAEHDSDGPAEHDRNLPDNSVPIGTAGPLLTGTDPGTLSSRFVAGEDFQWQHVGLATGK